MRQGRSVLFLAVCIGLFFFVGFATTDQARRKAAAKPAKIAVEEIDFDRLKLLVRRDPAKSQPLLINFWATWCDPCRDEFPDLVRIDSHYRSRGLQFAAVSLDDRAELTTGVPEFLRQMHAQVPAYLLVAEDPEPAIVYMDAEWSGSLPATFLIDGQGKIAYKHFGRIRVRELRAAIDQVLAQR
jgi:thiol-disulfide isomerase/thioredoxin